MSMLAVPLWRIPPDAAGETRVQRLLALVFRGVGAEDRSAYATKGFSRDWIMLPVPPLVAHYQVRVLRHQRSLHPRSVKLLDRPRIPEREFAGVI